MSKSTFDFQPNLAYAPKTVFSTTLANYQSSITFSVPAGVDTLDAYISARNHSGSGAQFVSLSFNGDTGSNYLSAYGREGNISTFESTANPWVAVASDSSTTTDMASGVIHFAGLSSGNTATATYSGGYYDGTDQNYVDLAVRWNSTAQVTTVTLTLSPTEFAAGSSLVVINPSQTTLAELKNNSFPIVYNENVSAAKGSITFNVPDGAEELAVYLSLQTVGSMDYARLSFNGDTGANYLSDFGRIGNTTGFSSTATPYTAIANGNGNTSAFSSGVLYLQNLSQGKYATASYNGTFYDGTDLNSAILSTQWTTTNQVTTVTLTLPNNFVAGSRIFVYNPTAVGGARALDDLYDVDTTGAVSGDLLGWDSGANAWKPTTFVDPTIYTETLSVAAPSITFAVPSANNELDVYISAKSSGAADYVTLAYNSDGTPANYESTYNRLGAVTDFNSSGSSNNVAVMSDTGYGFSNGVIHLQNLQNSSGATASYVGAFHDGTQLENIVMGTRWTTTSGVTSVTLAAASGFFAAGTTVTVVDPTTQGIGVLASVKKNYAIGSNDFANRQIWASQGSSQLTPTTEKAPTGEMAWKYSITSTANRALYQAMEFYGSSTWTLSMWVKALRVDTLHLSFMGAGANIAIDPANDWQRISLSATVNPTAPAVIQFYENAGSPSAGDVAYIASIQFEPGSTYTDYQSTSMGALSGSGGLSSSIYDSNGDGIVDKAHTLSSYAFYNVSDGTTYAGNKLKVATVKIKDPSQYYHAVWQVSYDYITSTGTVGASSDESEMNVHIFQSGNFATDNWYGAIQGVGHGTAGGSILDVTYFTAIPVTYNTTDGSVTEIWLSIPSSFTPAFENFYNVHITALHEESNAFEVTFHTNSITTQTSLPSPIASVNRTTTGSYYDLNIYNVWANELHGASVNSTGAISGASVNSTGVISGTSVNSTGAISGASVTSSGNITADGNITENGEALIDKYQGKPALISTGGSGTNWLYLGKLPTSTSGTMDVMQIRLIGGTWTDTPGELHALFRNRSAFSGQHYRVGISVNLNLQAYSQTDGSVNIYAVVPPSYKVLAVDGVQYTDSNQAHVRLININTVGSAISSTPAGTKVYDTGTIGPDARLTAGIVEVISALVLPVI